MRDLTSTKQIKIKAVLFLVLGLLSGVLLILERPTLKMALLLVVCIWAFCRFYYFAFYVIEHYVDPTFRFNGLLAFAGYLVRRKGKT